LGSARSEREAGSPIEQESRLGSRSAGGFMKDRHAFQAAEPSVVRQSGWWPYCLIQLGMPTKPRSDAFDVARSTRDLLNTLAVITGKGASDRVR
jgi:hypothetical protein